MATPSKAARRAAARARDVRRAAAKAASHNGWRLEVDGKGRMTLHR